MDYGYMDKWIKKLVLKNLAIFLEKNSELNLKYGVSD